ncbi:unnamed protein product, partial [marine sediment metagenome]
MNKIIKSEKYRVLSITALVIGILAIISVPSIIGTVVLASMAITINWELIDITILSSVFFWFVLPLVAIVCGSIDIKRIKAG